jgi:choline dehydrogenase
MAPAYDVIIVGAGSAGAALAARLTEDSRRSVLLLEAGPGGPVGGDDDQLANVSFALTARDWGMRAFVAPGREVDYPQGRYVGGGSSVNGALAFRGTPSDYDAWGERNPSWSWSSMLPCFRRLEHDADFGDGDVHGDDGPIPIVRWHDDEFVPLQQAFRRGCESVGFPWCADLNAPGTRGVGPFPMNRDGGWRVSTAMAYLEPARVRENLTLRAGALVRRVIVSSGRARGVEVSGPDGPEVLEGGTVVLSAGAVHTPAILWRSGVGPSDALRALGIEVVVDNPAVGRGLTDHPGAFVFARPAGEPGSVDPQYQLGVRYSSSTGVPDDMFLSMMNVFDLAAMPDLRAAVGAPTAVVLTCGVHEPRSRGSVTLTSADPAALPRIELNLLADPADTARLVEGVRRCRDVLRAGLGGFTDGVALLRDEDFDDDAALSAYVTGVVAPWYHASCTCRMGPSAEDGTVVGDRLDVHGVDGLRVVDASVMPKVCRAPTYLTTIAIAERAAELLIAP